MKQAPVYSTDSGNDMVTRARNGDIAAFEALVVAHRSDLYRFALGMTGGNADTASDALQDALIKAFINIRSFRGDAAFSTWLWRVIRNEIYSGYRKIQSEHIVDLDNESMPMEDHAPGPSEQSIQNERINNVRYLVGKLSPKLREIITLVDLMEYSYEETAEKLGISVGTVRSRVSRARDTFSRLVEKHGELFT